MGLVVLFLYGRLLERVLDVEGGGVVAAPVPGLLRVVPVVGVHVRRRPAVRRFPRLLVLLDLPVLDVGLDGQGLRVELTLAAGSDLFVDKLGDFGNVEGRLDPQRVLVDRAGPDLGYMCAAVHLLVRIGVLVVVVRL